MNMLYEFLPQSWDWVWRTTLQVSILICIIRLVQLVFRKKLSARWLYALWLLVIVRMVMPFGMETVWSVYNLFKVEQLEPATEFFFVPMTNPVTFSTDTFVAPPEPVVVLPWIWGVGVLLLGIHLWRQWLRIRRQVKNGLATSDPILLQLAESCRREIGLKKSYPIIESKDVSIPGLFGMFKPTLLLPTEFSKSLSVGELRLVILHEWAHVKRWDVFVNGIMTILQVFHWFNPLVWYAFMRMRSDRELACDALVLNGLNDEESDEYGDTLLKLMARHHGVRPIPGMVGVLENKAGLKRRIIAIAGFSRRSYRWSLLAMVLVAVVGSITLTQAKHEEPVSSHASVVRENVEETPTPEETSNEPAHGYLTLDLTAPYHGEDDVATKIEENLAGIVIREDGIEIGLDEKLTRFSRDVRSHLEPVEKKEKDTFIEVFEADLTDGDEKKPTKSEDELNIAKATDIQNQSIATNDKTMVEAREYLLGEKFYSYFGIPYTSGASTDPQLRGTSHKVIREMYTKFFPTYSSEPKNSIRIARGGAPSGDLSMRVRTTPQNHEKIAQFFASLEEEGNAEAVSEDTVNNIDYEIENARIRKVLKSKVGLVFEKIHISDILSFVQENYDVEMALDDRVVAPAGKSNDDAEHTTYVTDGIIEFINLKNVTLADALTAICRPLDLVFFVTEGKVRITARSSENKSAAVAQPLETRRYDVDDSFMAFLEIEYPAQNPKWIRRSGEDGTLEAIPFTPEAVVKKIDQIVPSVIVPSSGKRLSTIHLDYEKQELTMHTTPANHWIMEQFLENLKDGGLIAYEKSKKEVKAKNSISAALSKVVTLRFEDAHLLDVLEFMTDECGINIMLDNRVVNFPDSKKIISGASDGKLGKILMTNVTIERALGSLLIRLGLDYSQQENFIWISSRENMARESFENLETRTYATTERFIENLAKQNPRVSRFDAVDKTFYTTTGTGGSEQTVLDQMTAHVLEPVTGRRLSFIKLDEEKKRIVVHNTPTRLAGFEQFMTFFVDWEGGVPPGNGQLYDGKTPLETRYYEADDAFIRYLGMPDRLVERLKKGQGVKKYPNEYWENLFAMVPAVYDTDSQKALSFAFVNFVTNQLIVHNTPENHDKVVSILYNLSRGRQPSASKEISDVIDKALHGTRINLTFQDMHLSDIAALLAHKFDINIVLDYRVVRPKNFIKKKPAPENSDQFKIIEQGGGAFLTSGVIKNIEIRDVTLGGALEALLSRLGLAYVVKSDHVWVSSPAVLAARKS